MGTRISKRPSPDEEGNTIGVVWCPECNIKITIQFDRFKDERCKNWIKAILCLQRTKEGLEKFVETTTCEFYKEVKYFIASAVNCTNCTSDDISSRSGKCSICKQLVTKIIVSCNSGKPTWKNTNLKEMEASQNNVAKLFMLPQCLNYSSPDQGDITALLSFIAECRNATSKIRNPEYIVEVRKSRNEVMHSGTMILEEQQLQDIKTRCITLLMDEEHLKNDNDCQNAIESIIKIIGNSVQIDYDEEEKKSITDHNRHVEGELVDLKDELTETKCTPEKIEDVKKKIRKIEESQVGMKVTLDLLGRDSKKVLELKDMASDLLEHAEAKSKTIEMKKLTELQTKIEDLEEKVARNNEFEEQMKEINHAREKVEERQAELKPTFDGLGRYSTKNHEAKELTSDTLKNTEAKPKEDAERDLNSFSKAHITDSESDELQQYSRDFMDKLANKELKEYVKKVFAVHVLKE